MNEARRAKSCFFSKFHVYFCVKNMTISLFKKTAAPNSFYRVQRSNLRCFVHSSAAIPARCCPGKGERRCCAAAAGQESGLTEEESEAELCQGNASDPPVRSQGKQLGSTGGRHCHSCKQPHRPAEHSMYAFV